MAKNLKCFIPGTEDSDFSIYNIPFGIFSTKKKSHRVGSAIGDYIIDLVVLSNLGCFDGIDIDAKVFSQSSLNDFISSGKSKTKRVRKKIQSLLSDKNSPIKGRRGLLVKKSDAKMHMPVEVGDYTDFYSSIEHATNVGVMFRDPKNALLPNWRHIPVGYHGRASSIVVSGTNIRRPQGQTLPKGAKIPVYGPSKRLDFELEMAFIIGKENKLGNPISADKANDHIFGMVLFNDWSARDIQKWEYVPLGPFLGKNFASSVSPWVVTMEALEIFKVRGPKQEPKVLPYLRTTGLNNYNINLEVSIKPKGADKTVVSRSNFKYMYWNMRQQLTHHTVNGCNVKVGDMMASGTISGKNESSYGSMLEISWAGTKPVKMDDGSSRVFINDGDTLSMRGYCEKEGKRVGFGEVVGTVLPVK